MKSFFLLLHFLHNAGTSTTHSPCSAFASNNSPSFSFFFFSFYPVEIVILETMRALERKDWRTYTQSYKHTYVCMQLSWGTYKYRTKQVRTLLVIVLILIFQDKCNRFLLQLRYIAEINEVVTFSRR